MGFDVKNFDSLNQAGIRRADPGAAADWAFDVTVRGDWQLAGKAQTAVPVCRRD